MALTSTTGGVGSPKGLPPEYDSLYLDNWGALTSTTGGVGSPKGLPPEYNGMQLTTPDLDRAFNAILGRRAQGTSRPDRTTIYPNLIPDRLKP
ncbi:hypothetical protein PanWU01x14_131780 [Parasponia andersonii]|uniref:Uncharacterized protein n=1 Tax=Parasponia andersonii TaxID=3476 RepID=A0A2P5CR43_PARAD|nr:hypothetical protein PanWU01x14_131780 [Parasponia andersonii]